MKYEKPTIYNTAEQHLRIFNELSVAKAVIENNNELIADLSKKVERLQEQLKEANEVIKDYDGFTAEITPDGKYACNYANSAHLYLEKWGVK